MASRRKPAQPQRHTSARSMIKIIQRGLAGYLTHTAAAGGWHLTSELALYPVIGAILSGRGWSTQCQVRVCKAKARRGAPETIDIFAFSHSAPTKRLAIEIKLLPSRGAARTVKVKRDADKLRALDGPMRAVKYILIVGREQDISRTRLDFGDKKLCLSEMTDQYVIANLQMTKWGSVAVEVGSRSAL